MRVPVLNRIIALIIFRSEFIRNEDFSNITNYETLKEADDMQKRSSDMKYRVNGHLH